MSALPRLLAVTTDAVCREASFAERAAAIATAGSSAALVVRAPESTTLQQAQYVEQVRRVAAPLDAPVLVHARPDLARAVGAAGVQLRRSDLAPHDARRVLGEGWIGVSVHDRREAETALAEGADYLVAGNVFETSSHPGRPPRGLAWLAELCTLRVPVFAIGGITAARVAAVAQAGAWGVAAISALWESAEPARAARALLSAWSPA